MRLPLARHRKPRASKPVAAQTSPGTGLRLLLLVTAGRPLLGLRVPQAWGQPPTTHRGPAVQIQLACVDQRLPVLSMVDTPRPSPLRLPFPVRKLACQAPGTLGLMGHFPHFMCSIRCLLGHPQSCNPSPLVPEHSTSEKKPCAHEQPLPPSPAANNHEPTSCLDLPVVASHRVAFCIWHLAGPRVRETRGLDSPRHKVACMGSRGPPWSDALWRGQRGLSGLRPAWWVGVSWTGIWETVSGWRDPRG